MTPRLPKWIWPVGIALILYSGVDFILDSSRPIKDAGTPAATYFIVPITICVALVAIYWARKWLQLRQVANPGESLLAKVPRRFRIWLVILPIAFGALLVQYFRMSLSPELGEAQKLIETNDAIRSSFGSIDHITTDVGFWNITTENGVRQGYYTFNLVGSLRSGIVQIHWRDEDGKFKPTEIDSLRDGHQSNPDILWKETAP